MLATVSFLPALNDTLRSAGDSGASAITALSAIFTDTSSLRCAARGTNSVEPPFTSMCGGMRLTSRSCASLMPTRLAASAGFRVLGAIQAVQVAMAPWCSASARTKRSPLSYGSST